MFSNKSLRNLILPLLVEQFLGVSIGIVGTIMVSSCGEAAVSGISMVDSLNFLILMVFSSLATGGAVISSQYIGKGEPWNASKAAKQLEYLVFGISIILTVLVLFLRNPLLRAIFGGIEEDVMENAQTYFFYSSLSYPFIAIYSAGAALFRSMGDSRTSMFIAILMNIINVGGNFILIFVLDFGVAGAAISMLCARVAGAIIVTLLLMNPDRKIHIDEIKKFEFNGKMVKSILKIGIPSGIENSIFQVGKILVASIVAGLGTASITANAVGGNLASLQIIPGSAIGMAMLTVVGQCVGAKDYAGVKKHTRNLLIVCYGAMWIMTGLMVIFSEPILGLYSISGETAEITADLFFLHAIFAVLIWPTAFALPNALRAANDGKFTMVVSLISMWAFRIACSYLFVWGFNWGVYGIWIAMCIDWVFRAALFGIRFVKGKWQKISYI